MQQRELIMLGVAFFVAGFIIINALARRPSIVELTARIEAQKMLRDEWSNKDFVNFAFNGEITEVEKYVVRVPLREYRVKVFFKPDGRIVIPAGAPDSTELYNFKDLDNPYFMLAQGQENIPDEEEIIIKKPGQNVFYIEDEDGDRDTLQVSFRLFEPPEDFDDLIDSVEKRIGDQIEF